MQLCRVTGTAVAPQKAVAFETSKLLVVQSIRLDGTSDGTPDRLALDPGYGAGTGDVVLVVREGGAVRQILGRDDAPANVVIVGVVDDWSVEED